MKLWQCVSATLDKFSTYAGLTQYYAMKTPYVKNKHGKMSLLWTQRNVRSSINFYKTPEYILNKNTSGHFEEENPITGKSEGLL